MANRSLCAIEAKAIYLLEVHWKIQVCVVVVFRWVLGKLGWLLKLVRVASGVGNCLQFLHRSKDQMRQLFPAAAECIGGEAVACRTLACLKTAWSGVTFHLLFPVASGVDWSTGNLGAASFLWSWS